MAKHNSCDKVIEVLDRLLGPGGCPWDREQTLLSLRGSFLEEVCELIDAINSGDKAHIQEELGDVLLNALFFAKVADKENVCSFEGVVDELADKLIRRHPHVFENSQELKTEELLQQWDAIKQTEKGKGVEERTGVFDGIPVSLPALARAQKMYKRLKKKGISVPSDVFAEASPTALALWDIVVDAQAKEIDAEIELRHLLSTLSQGLQSVSS